MVVTQGTRLYITTLAYYYSLGMLVMVPLAATGYGSQSKNAVRWLNGTHDIGSTTQDLLINKLYNGTAAAQYGWHGDTGFIRGKEAIEKYHKDQEGFSSVISLARQESYCTVYCLGETMLPLPPPVETCAHGAMAYCKTNLNTHPLFTVAACGSTAQCGVKVDW
ncbi:hypothetical protein O0I10_003146 [Lichtheimia ornata]|uniref:Uncharacterized protein n=1 Tax=Lichtheimia ornata TaxID=688661 RepID=A0AAD7V7L1_9FUNG|nr:uncharacterized protein O0I10_003146 [Lichtheimia ornata]KAJ8660924.1 hypothetical protein O0I10_003146 [Lichtheimia ornata]